MQKTTPIKDIPSLTGLRFFAAIFVVIYHYYRLGADPYQSPASRFLTKYASFLGRSDYMVDLFFVLSGFVLMYVYITKISNRSFSYRDFLIKRFARVYPLHIATFVFFITLKFGFGNSAQINMKDIFANITLTHAWGVCKELSFNYPSWSISAEWFAYLLFPVIATIVLYQKPLIAVITAAIFFIVCALTSQGLGVPITDRKADFGIFRIISEFPLGIALARYYCSNSFCISTISAWLLFLATILSIQFNASPIIVVLEMALLTYACACAERTKSIPILSHPTIVFGGLISYSIYLVHVPVLAIGTKIGDKLGILTDSLSGDLVRFLLVLLTIGISTLTYWYLEIPARDFATKTLSPKPSPKETSTTQAASPQL